MPPKRKATTVSELCFTLHDTEYCDAGQCSADYLFGDRIGSGATAAVFCASDRRRSKAANSDDQQQQCKYVAKVIPLHEDEAALFEREAELARLMGANAIGPTVHNHWICEVLADDGVSVRQRLGFIVSDRLAMTVTEYATGPQRSLAGAVALRAAVSDLSKRLEKLGYQHGDVTGNNIMLNLDDANNVTDVRFIDFSQTRKSNALTKGETSRRASEIMKRVIASSSPWSR